MKSKFILLLLLSTLLTACDGIDFKESKTFLGGQQVDAKTLNLGKQVYIEYCMSCHGEKGDGNGIAAKGSVPPPRNFTQGLYKFGYVKDSGLPTDEDFKRIIQGGLHGTGMLKWDISDRQTYAVTQYIKTFAPQVWEVEDGTVGEPIDVANDPYGLARKQFAIEKGKEIYHQVANCQACHRAYVTKDELAKIYAKYNKGEKLTDFDDEMYKLKLQESEYYFHDSKDRYAKFLPPDFTWHEVRSAQTVNDLYMRLVAGVTGSGMPAWKDVITDDEIWAVAYYVKSLMEMKDSSLRKELMEKIENQ
jgi:mono/diheme cytochrome c family protein